MRKLCASYRNLNKRGLCHTQELKGAVTSCVDYCNLWADAAALSARTSAVTTKSSKLHPLDLSSLWISPSTAREPMNGFVWNLVFVG